MFEIVCVPGRDHKLGADFKKTRVAAVFRERLRVTQYLAFKKFLYLVFQLHFPIIYQEPGTPRGRTMKEDSKKMRECQWRSLVEG